VAEILPDLIKKRTIIR